MKVSKKFCKMYVVALYDVMNCTAPSSLAIVVS